ncbi:MAG: DUF3987 domain-containing protein [Gemmataceae bacterium]|nr:DUF3987 domain-containing protein [Gemmataceae bacterium]
MNGTSLDNVDPRVPASPSPERQSLYHDPPETETVELRPWKRPTISPNVDGFSPSSTPLPPGAPPRQPQNLQPRGTIPAAPPFPVNALPVAVRQFVQSVAAALPCPVDLVAVAALGAISPAIGNTRHLQIKAGWIEGPQLWLAIVCDSGPKKSPALAAATQPLHDAQQRHWTEYQNACAAEPGQAAGPQDSQEKTSRGARRSDAARPVLRQVLTSDTTRGGLLDLLEENPRGMALITDELVGWAGGIKRDDVPFWLSVWSGTKILANRARRTGQPHVYLPRPMISVMGCLPPSALKQLESVQRRHSDFLHRLLFSWPEPQPHRWSEAEPTPEAVAAYSQLFERLLALDAPVDATTQQLRPRVLTWTPEGKAAWLRYEERLMADLNGKDLPDGLRGSWAKMEGYGARLALVLHVVRYVMGETQSADVDETSVTSAARLIEYFRPMRGESTPAGQSATIGTRPTRKQSWAGCGATAAKCSISPRRDSPGGSSVTICTIDSSLGRRNSARRCKRWSIKATV